MKVVGLNHAPASIAVIVFILVGWVSLPHSVAASHTIVGSPPLPQPSFHADSINTTLRLQVSNRTVYVGEALVVRGYLTVGVYGIIPSDLTGRNVTLFWGTSSAIETTDQYGWFTAYVTFPPGYTAGPTNITAIYNPSPSNPGDIGRYQPSRSSVQVMVMYIPTTLTATISNSTTQPLATVTINGNLSAATGPLQERSVQIALDGRTMGNAVTASTGLFSFILTIPNGTTGGTHTITVSYASDQDFASAEATLQLTVLSSAASTSTAIATSTSTLNSTQITLTQVSAQGNAVAASVGTLDFTLVVIICAAIMGVIYLAVKRRRKAELVLESPPSQQPAPGLASSSAMHRPSTVEPEEKGLGKEWSSAEVVAQVDAQPDDASKIGTAYELVKRLFEERFGLAPAPSETHWEYFNRAIRIVPELEEPLRKMVELFEVSQYAPQPSNQKQRDATVHSATVLLLEIIDKTKTLRR